jgi:hypothetical protein
MNNRKLRYGEKTVLVSSFRCPESKVEEFRSKCYDILDSWLVYNIEVRDPIVLKEEKEIVKDEILDDEQSQEFITDTKSNLDYIQFGTSITSLPKERKMIIEEDLKGLYVAGNKWYTNKIVDNKLVIFEWDNLDYAKKYLKSLIK